MILPAITPGPEWVLQSRGDSWVIVGEHKHNHPAVTGIVVARVDEPHAEANAKAIAAVPALLEALVDARSAVASLDEDALGLVENPPHQWWPIRDELLAKIDAALRLAGASE